MLRPLFTHTNTVQYKYKHFLLTQIQNWSARVLAADSHGETKLSFMQCEETPSQMDVAPWCYKRVVDWLDWITPGGGMYRVSYSANR